MLHNVFGAYSVMCVSVLCVFDILMKWRNGLCKASEIDKVRSIRNEEEEVPFRKK